MTVPRPLPARLQTFGRLMILVIWMGSFLSLYGLRGRIIDSSGQSVEGASVSDGQKIVYSDTDGSFNLNTQADSIYISRPGYHKLAVNIRGNLNPIMLATDPISMPTVWVRAVEYRPSSPSLSARVIYPDTNESAQGTQELLLKDASFYSVDIPLSGERQTLSLLGSFSRHSLVMMDGVVLNSAGEAFDFSRIPLGQIERIEIIKGNASVYGGSAAIGGIIHIHTRNRRQVSDWDAELNASAASFSAFRQSYRASFGKRGFTARAEYSHQTARNDFLYDTPDFWNTEPELRRLHNRKTADALYSKLNMIIGGLRIDGAVNAGSFIRQLPGPVNFLELYDASRLTGSYSQLSLQAATSVWDAETELQVWSNSDHSSYTNLESTNPFGRNHYSQAQRDSGIKLSSRLESPLLNLQAATEYSRTGYRFHNRLTDSAIQGDRDNGALAVRAQTSLYPKDFDYRIGIAGRADYSDAVMHPTWRLEQDLSWVPGPKLTVGAYLGTAFSKPSLFDMYWIGDSETEGNPDLESEASFGWNVYGAIESTAFRLRTAWYQNWVENLIQWRQYYLNGVSWKPFNVGRADLRNLELEAQLSLWKRWSINGGLTLTKATDRSRNQDGSVSSTYGKALVYTPDYKGILGLGYAELNLGASLTWSLTGEQHSTPDNLIDPLPAYNNLDAAAYYRIAAGAFNLQLDLKLNNILDKRYSIYSYTPQPGFNWLLSLSVSASSQIKARQELGFGTKNLVD